MLGGEVMLQARGDVVGVAEIKVLAHIDLFECV
jgi:hypothetical protein